jgi:N-acetylglucosamine-6-sulfatase
MWCVRFVCAALAAATCELLLAEEVVDARPNILFILLDDLRWDALSSTGHPFVKTPNIDRIAREGATFRNAFVTTPLCFPSRASFLTGQYAHKHGIKLAGDRAKLSHGLVTWPLLLQRTGYRTSFIGKWHLGNDHKPAPGVDRWVSFRDQGEYVDPELNIDGNFVKQAGYLTDLLTDEAVEFIRNSSPQPFAICLSHKAVHAPFVPAERHKTLFADVPIVRAASASDPLDGKPVLRRPGIRLSPGDPDVHSSDEMIRDQLRCLIAVDEGMGRIFAALEAKKQLERTMIVFSSDNGYFWGEHDLGGKHGPYEEALRVPLLMRYPKLIQPGTKVDQFALSVDVAPTLVALAGLAPLQDMQGISLLPLLAGDAAIGRPSFLAEFFLGNGTNRFPDWQAVRTTDWKYVRYPGMAGMDELYALASDPHEMRNLINDPASAAKLAYLQAELERLLTPAK